MVRLVYPRQLIAVIQVIKQFSHLIKDSVKAIESRNHRVIIVQSTYLLLLNFQLQLNKILFKGV